MMRDLFSLLTSHPVIGAIGMLAILAFLGWGAVSLRDSATEQCNQAHETKRLQDVEKQMDATLDEIERGNKISAQLAQTQRRLDETKTEYLAYASGIAGNCPADLGVLVNAAAAGQTLPETTGAPADPAATVAAAAIGQNIAENYARCTRNAAQLSALIRWVDGQEDMTHE